MAQYKRSLHFNLPPRQSAFLWGPRKTGKSTLLRERFPDSVRFDLLDTRTAMELHRAPWTLGDRLRALPPSALSKPVIIDEVQKVPRVLNEVHRLIEDEGLSFVLCSSSARKLKRGGAHLLGGRAWRYHLCPLSWQEVLGLDLLRALNHGLIPQHYDSDQPRRALEGYVDDYLKEEVYQEGLTRKMGAFSRFLDALSYSHGELLNYASIARDCGVSARTVREYFQILEDTLLGTRIEPFRRRVSRQVILRAPRFYLFDVGVAGYLCGRHIGRPIGAEFGRALEHLVLMELLAYGRYRGRSDKIRFWRTKSGLECDFVLGRDGGVAIEVKGTARLRPADLRGIRAYVEEHDPRLAIVVCSESAARRTPDGVWILPWEHFFERLWSDRVLR